MCDHFKEAKSDIVGDGEKCCLVVKLEVGIWFLGASQIIYTVQTIWGYVMALCYVAYSGADIKTSLALYILGLILCQVPSYLAAIYYGRYFVHSDRGKLPKAHLCNIVSLVLIYIWVTYVAESLIG